MDAKTLLDRVPPQNLEAEQSALGSMMIDKAALEKGVDMLKSEDFYRDAHQIIFLSLMGLAEKGEPVDIVTVQEELRGAGKLDQVGGTEYLMALIDSVPTSANLEYYAKIVEEKAIFRRLIDACSQIISWSHEQGEEADSIIDRAERLIFQISQKQMGEYFTHLSGLAHHAYEKIEQQSIEKKQVYGLPTGFHALDGITTGLQTSDFVIVAARPSMGKTAFCLDIARHVAIQEKLPVAIFSLEMSKEQLVLRLICSEAHVDSHRVRTGYLNKDEWKPLTAGVDRLYTAPIYIDDSTGTNAMQMRAKCRRLKAEHGLGLVIVDYLQLMQSHRRVENRNQEISEIARALKGLARDLKVPVIALSQLSRAVEHRVDRRPMLSDLRESGSIEAEADVVMMLYRKDYYQQKEFVMAGAEDDAIDFSPPDEPDEKDVAEIIVAKQRNGPTGTIKLKFMSKFACFENLEEHRRDPGE